MTGECKRKTGRRRKKGKELQKKTWETKNGKSWRDIQERENEREMSASKKLKNKREVKGLCN